MAKKSVVDYVKSMLQGGYQISSIRAAMLKSGYTNEDIDDAVKEAYHPTIRHEIHLGPTVLFVAILVILVGGGVAYFTLNPSKAPDKLLDVNLEPVQTTVKPGESIIFLKELSNLGTEARYDVIIKQEILDPITFKPIAEKTETRAIETFGSTKTQILIPQDSRPGDYILRAIVEYDAKKAVATIPIKIVPAGKETLQDFCNDGIQNQDESHAKSRVYAMTMTLALKTSMQTASALTQKLLRVAGMESARRGKPISAMTASQMGSCKTCQHFLISAK